MAPTQGCWIASDHTHLYGDLSYQGDAVVTWFILDTTCYGLAGELQAFICSWIDGLLTSEVPGGPPQLYTAQGQLTVSNISRIHSIHL